MGLFNQIIFSRRPSSGGDITTGLVAWWRFDEGSGTSAADATGNGHTGTLNSGVGWTTGKIGTHAVAYPGTTGAGVSISSLTTGTTFTYAAWIFHAGSGGFSNLISQDSGHGIWVNGGKISFFGTSASNLTTMSDSVWYHVVVVNNGGAVTYYLNGVADGTATGGYSFPAAGMGADGGTGGEAFGGNHDDVRLYSRALSQADITALFNFT